MMELGKYRSYNIAMERDESAQGLCCFEFTVTTAGGVRRIERRLQADPKHFHDGSPGQTQEASAPKPSADTRSSVLGYFEDQCGKWMRRLIDRMLDQREEVVPIAIQVYDVGNKLADFEAMPEENFEVIQRQCLG
jgi:hypothetical protein